jgi:trimethylamine--corrinoid protein Co-methyltransferase
MILSLEQLMIDVEVFRMYKRAWQGITIDDDKWLEDVIDQVGPGGNFLAEMSTVKGIRNGEWYVSKFGVHNTFEDWEAAGRSGLLKEAREKVNKILASHEPLPLGDEVERELDRIQKRAEVVAQSSSR